VDQNRLKELLDLGYLVLFTIGVTLTAGRLWGRVQEYRKAQDKIPWLLWRDVVLFTGLAIPFLFILFARASGIAPIIRDEVAWTVVTGTPPVLAVWFWFWVEQFSLRAPRRK